MFARELFAILLLAPLADAQRVFVVDANGKGTHRSVQLAVDAARDGDWVLIRSGTYKEHVKIDGKSLWLQGTTAPPHVDTIRWSNHPSGRTSRIANLKLGISRSGFPFPTSTSVRGKGSVVVARVTFVFAGAYFDLSGNVSLRNCSVEGSKLQGQFGGPKTGLSISNAALVAIHGCRIRGAFGTPSGVFFNRGGPGLYVERCKRLEISASTIVGGAGVYYYCGFSCGFHGTGGPGLQLRESIARIRGGRVYTITGGTGSSRAAAGGPGILVEQNSRLVVGGVLVAGGSGSRAGTPISTDASSSVVIEREPYSPYLTMAAPFRLGYDAKMRVHGQSKHVAVVLVFLTLRPVDLRFGTVYLDPSSLMITRASVMDANGIASFTIPTGTDPDLLRVPLFMQGVEVSPTSNLRLTSVAGLVPSFW